jgi:hypothetical protein
LKIALHEVVVQEVASSNDEAEVHVDALALAPSADDVGNEDSVHAEAYLDADGAADDDVAADDHALNGVDDERVGNAGEMARSQD